ncbi:Protein of unknown function [Arboricoccus pini]|uniref:DUF3800 domain-containing protein n=1 Tax=Arboricoccus pini TaxID=1963835 RepID=A0A212PZU2_9PROT|nr:DUF3800 domain-containing protein [Arboricoccus pini]SNB52597.1 Protein of unknown function [Arboricoccus pini]
MYSDYIVYADESGDTNLDKLDPEFPIFVLAFCPVKKSDYIEHIVPAMQRLKFEFFGHDDVVFHEREIRKQIAPFSFMRESKEAREDFFTKINDFVATSPMRVFASVIHKAALKQKYANPWSPYHLAFSFAWSGFSRRCATTNSATGLST